MRMIEQTKRLLELIEQNPELRIMPLVENDVCGGDEFAYWLGSFGSAAVDEVVSIDDYFYIKSNDIEALTNKIIDDECLDLEVDMTSEQINEYVEKVIASYDWEKVIVVYIGLPELLKEGMR